MQRILVVICLCVLVAGLCGAEVRTSVNIVGITADGKFVNLPTDAAGNPVLTVPGSHVPLTETISVALCPDELEERIAPSLTGSIRYDDPPRVKPPQSRNTRHKYGYLYARSARLRVYFAVGRDADAAGGAWTSLVLDQNGDRDLGNDPVIALTGSSPVKTTIRLIKDRPIDCEAVVDSRSVRIRHPQGLTGVAEIGANRLAVAVADTTFDGRYRIGDTLLLDRNSNGQFDVHSMMHRSRHVERLALTRLMHIDGLFFVPEIDEAASRLTLKRYTGDTGELKFSGEGLGPLQEDRARIYATVAGVPRHEGSFHFSLPVSDFPLAMPAGAYERFYCYIGPTNGTDLVKFSINRVEIRSGQEYTVKLDKPSIAVSVRERDRKLQISQATNGPDGISYLRIYPSQEAATKRGRQGPAVSIALQSKPDQPLHTGNMEYG